MGSDLPSCLCTSTASQENSQALLGLGAQRKGLSVGWGWEVGLGNCIFLVLGVQDSFFWALTEGPSRELGPPPVSHSQLLNHPPVASSTGEGQAWDPGSHLPEAREMASSAPSRQDPALSLVSCQSALPGEGGWWLISDAVVEAGSKTVGRPEA